MITPTRHAFLIAALFPLTLSNLLLASTVTTSGQIWFDSSHQLYQHTADEQPVIHQLRPLDVLGISRLDLNMRMQLQPHWSLRTRLGISHINNKELRDDNTYQPLPWEHQLSLRQFFSHYESHAYGQWSLGLISVPQISPTSQQQSVMGVDPNAYHVIASAGQKLGAIWEKDFGLGVLQFAVWQQSQIPSIASLSSSRQGVASFLEFSQAAYADLFLTPEDYHHNRLQIGLNTCWHYYPVHTENAAMAFNFGLQQRPLTRPLLVATLSQLGNAANIVYSVSAHNILQECALSMSSYWGRFLLEAQAQYQLLPQAHQLRYGNVDAQQQLYRDLFNSDAYGTGYNTTIGYHFAGGYYTLDRSSGQLLRAGHGWDVGLSLGAVVQKNALALLSDLGSQNYTATSFGDQGDGDFVTGQGRLSISEGPSRSNHLNLEEYDYVAIDSSYPRAAFQENEDENGFNALQENSQHPKSYQIRTQSYTFHLSYAYNENLVWQIELQNARHQQAIYRQGAVDTAYTNAPLSASFQYLRTRLHITF